MTIKVRIYLCLIGICALLIILKSRVSAAETSFYESKTLRILVSSGTGGGTDTAARLVSRFIGKYLPGNPKVVVQNMPGGGGTIANNYFANEVKADGLSIMQDSSSGIGNFVRGGPTIKYDPRRNKMIGGVARSGSLLVIRSDARERLTSRNAKPVVVGDTGEGNQAQPLFGGHDGLGRGVCWLELALDLWLSRQQRTPAGDPPGRNRYVGHGERKARQGSAARRSCPDRFG
jgi:hypothetical protein